MITFISLILSVCALAIAIIGNGKHVNLLSKKSHRIMKEDQNQAIINDLTAQISALRDSLTEAQNKINDLTFQLGSLNGKVTSLEKANSTDISRNKPADKNQSQTAPVVSNVAQPVSNVTTTKYVQEFVNGEILDSKLLDNKTKFTKFIVHISGNEATYEIPADPSCQEKLLNGYTTIQPFLDEKETVESPSAIENVQAGKLMLRDGIWTITRKLIVRLV